MCYRIESCVRVAVTGGVVSYDDIIDALQSLDGERTPETDARFRAAPQAWAAGQVERSRRSIGQRNVDSSAFG